MATSRPSSRNLAAKTTSKSQIDCKRNGEDQITSGKQKKRSTSSRQSQNDESQSNESQSQEPQSQKSQCLESQSQKSQSQKSLRLESSSSKTAGCLEILTPEALFPEILRPSERPCSGNRAKKAPSINRVDSAPRRTPTPTKQIILEAAKRRPEPTLIVEETNLRIRKNEATKDENVKESGQRSLKAKVRTKDDEKKNEGNDEDDDDDDEEDDDEEESSSEEELIKAPNELMMEFLDCVLKEDYANGLKLCTMILLYEPENTEALSFKSLIEEKMAFDVSNEDDSEDDKDDDDDDDEDDDDEDDSSEDDSDTSETSDEEEKEEEAQTKTDQSNDQR